MESLLLMHPRIMFLFSDRSDGLLLLATPRLVMLLLLSGRSHFFDADFEVPPLVSCSHGHSARTGSFSAGACHWIAASSNSLTGFTSAVVFLQVGTMAGLSARQLLWACYIVQQSALLELLAPWVPEEHPVASTSAQFSAVSRQATPKGALTWHKMRQVRGI